MTKDGTLKHQDHCRICRSKDLVQYLDLGMMPLANHNLSSSELDVKESLFPLQILFCRDCYLSQLSVVVPPGILYDQYGYFSSVSQTFQQHCREMVAKLKKQLNLKSSSLVVEIASNDGCLLSKFADAELKAIGVEPASNLASFAQAKGCQTICAFWQENVARNIQQEHGYPDLIIGTNVLAHVDDLDGFLQVTHAALNAEGFFVFEVPYMVNYIEHAEFDTTYHEHLSYFLLSPLKRALEANGFRIIDVEQFKIHGGTIRVICGKKTSTHSSSAKVDELLDLEKTLGLWEEKTYVKFAVRIEKIRDEFKALIKSLKRESKCIAAYGASAKGNVLFNYCRIDKDAVDYIIDDTPFKQGKFQSGTHIPIMPQIQMRNKRPDYLLLLAWNFADELMGKTVEYHKAGGHYIVPLPELRVIHSSYPIINLQERNAMSSMKVAAVLPAYQSAATVADVLTSLPREYFQSIILVDDYSRDKTFEIASYDKSIVVYRNEKNLGYGGNLKKCFNLALQQGADIVVEIHPDGEYGLESIGLAIEEIRKGAGLVLGNRFAADGDPLKSGMYFWKYPFVRGLTWIGNWALGTNLGDLHQGFRVYSSTYLKSVDFERYSDEYIFSFQIIVEAVFNKFVIKEVPKSCYYKGKKRGAKLVPVIIYSLLVFIVIGQFLLAKCGLFLGIFKDLKRKSP